MNPAASWAGHTPWKPGHPDPHPIFVSDIDGTDEPDWIKKVIRDREYPGSRLHSPRCRRGSLSANS